MEQLVLLILLACSSCLVLESLLKLLARMLRRILIHARRHCSLGHTWGRRFGPYMSGYAYYWGWKCIRCDAVRTTQIYSWQARAVQIARDPNHPIHQGKVEL